MVCRGALQWKVRHKTALFLAKNIMKGIREQGLTQALQDQELVVPRGSIKKRSVRAVLVGPWLCSPLLKGRVFTNALAKSVVHLLAARPLWSCTVFCIHFLNCLSQQ